MTMIELMIAVAIMAVALSAMLSGLFTLSQAHQSGKEMAKVQQIAQVFAERVQGATWHTLGTRAQPWSWHRREGAAVGMPQPLREKAVNAADDLQALGLISDASGLADLRVHLEYVTMPALVDPTSGAWMVRTAKEWNARRSNAAFVMTQDPDAFDLREVEDAVIIRVLITWNSHEGVPRRHEISFSRRK